MKFKQVLLFICYIIIPLLVLNQNYVACDTLKISDQLVNCYRTNNNSQSLLLPWTPNTLQILLELIRKIEDAHPTSIDIRYLTVNLLHHLRIDGIQKSKNAYQNEYITPYHVNDQLSTKLNILLNIISDVPGAINFTNILTQTELCLLHELISSTIEPSIRGDEYQTCYQNKFNFENPIPSNRIFGISNRPYIISQEISKCPVEKGIIRTYYYGTFSPGTLISSISAGLQPQLILLRDLFPALDSVNKRFENLETMERRDTNKNIKKLLRSEDTIDNTFSSNLAGDLAEVCVYQSPYYETNIQIGSNGYWNDTEYPIKRYINESIPLNWSITDSEILAGIDGHHLSKNIQNWVNRINRMKLSQILEMYYSSHGVLNLSIENANLRKRAFTNSGGTSSRYMAAIGVGTSSSSSSSSNQNDYYNPLPVAAAAPAANQPNYYDSSDRYGDSACERTNILNRISREKLKDETYNLARILQCSINTVTVDDDLLKKTCDITVDKFYDYTLKLLKQLPKCKNIRRPNIDLILIIDDTRNQFDTLKLISFLTEVIDVSTFGSRITVINGENGDFLVKSTHSIVNAFEQLRNYTGKYPNSLSLSASFSSVFIELERKTRENLLAGILSDMSQVIFVVSQSQEIRQNDFDEAKSILDGAFQQYPNLYFMFLTNNQKTFADLIQDTNSISTANKYTIIETNQLNPKQFASNILRTLRTIPKWLHLPTCNHITSSKFNHPSDNYVLSLRNEVEDYVSRYRSNVYRLNGQQLQGHSILHIKFQGVGYGVITVCMETQSNNNKECKSTQNLADELIWFNNTRVCDMANVKHCPDIYFTVELDSSNVKCTENSCRFPDDVRYNIYLHNDNCSSATSLFQFINFYYVISSLIVLSLIQLS